MKLGVQIWSEWKNDKICNSSHLQDIKRFSHKGSYNETPISSLFGHLQTSVFDLNVYA